MPKPRSKKPTNIDQGQLRIIAGQWRGRKLVFPAVDGLRPTGDRIRETLFNWLQNDIADANCLDLFAGAGGLGLEALSRGANNCQLIEKNPAASKALVQNLKTLACHTAQVTCMDAVAWLQQSPHTLTAESESWDIVFCDPPFALDLWQSTIAALSNHPLLSPSAYIYVEAPKSKNIETPADWSLHRTKDAGQVRIYLFHRNG